MAISAESSLVGGDRPVQTFAPNGTKVVSLSVNSSTTDMSYYVLFSAYSASGTCFIRLMATTAKGTNTQVPLPNTTWITLAKNPATPFVNMSGCVGGFLQRQ
jgi:hypothetical protein